MGEQWRGKFDSGNQAAGSYLLYPEALLWLSLSIASISSVIGKIFQRQEMLLTGDGTIKLKLPPPKVRSEVELRSTTSWKLTYSFIRIIRTIMIVIALETNCMQESCSRDGADMGCCIFVVGVLSSKRESKQSHVNETLNLYIASLFLIVQPVRSSHC